LLLAGSASRQETVGNLVRATELLPDCRLVLFDGMPFNVMNACPDECVAETMKFIDAHGAGPR
jgi:hypothetical protein